MEDNSIVLQFNVQSYAQNFKMLCLGVAAASHGQMTVRQLINLIKTVNSEEWRVIPGQWVQIADVQSTIGYAMDVVGWTVYRLSDMAIAKVETENAPKKWELRLDYPRGLTLEDNICSNNVNHPNHYVSGRFEVIDIIEEFCSSLEGRAAFDNGNAIKYILRWHRKNGVEDLKKAMWYIQDLIKQVESEENNNENSTDN